MRKTILYIIDSLNGIGGAEIMLVSPLAEIYQSYNIIIVTLEPGNVFEKSGYAFCKQYCLNLKSRTNVFAAAKKLKKIINENNVSIVHSFLYWSVIVARLACGNKTKHVFSLATLMSTGIYKDKWYSRYTQLIDRVTYKKNQFIISPTQEVLKDFDKSIGIKGKHKVLYNFVDGNFFKNEMTYIPPCNKLQLVAVGNLKKVKNYQLLMDAFKLLRNDPVTLDIYGEGSLRQFLQNQITEYGLPIKLMGSCEKIHEVLHKYDAFVMSSFLEGFGISAAEAMAAGLPLILSDINTFREVSQGNALFFNPKKLESFQSIIHSILNGEVNMKQLSDNGKGIARDNYKKEKYITGLLKLYNEVLNEDILK